MIKNKGFTLVELLITVSIISVLSVIGTITFQSVNKNSRDAKRQSDLKLIQSAIEQYHGDQYNYPANADLTFGGSLTSGAKTYYNIIPKDPQDPTYAYCYSALPTNCDNTAGNKCSSYELFALLENPPSGSPSYSCGTVSAYNYKVTPP